MRSKMLMLAFVAVLALVPGAVFAQPTGSPSPAPKTAVKTLFDYQKELGLTDKQVTGIRAALTGLQESLGTLGKRLKAADSEATQAIQAEAPLAQIRAKLQEVANLQIEMRLVDIETSRKVNAILTKDQVAKWRAIQKKARGGK